MLKDIPSPIEIDGLHTAVVKQWNETLENDEWNVFLINDSPFTLEHVIVLSHGRNTKDKTSTMRHKIDVLPARSFAKIELIQPELFKLDNTFEVSYLKEGRLGKMSWTFQQDTITDKALETLPLIPNQGILAQQNDIQL